MSITNPAPNEIPREGQSEPMANVRRLANVAMITLPAAFGTALGKMVGAPYEGLGIGTMVGLGIVIGVNKLIYRPQG